MKLKDFLLRVLVLVLVIVGGFTILRLAFMRGSDAPNVGGQSLPSVQFELDFSKRYDIVIGSQWDNRESSTLPSVKFLGWVSGQGQGLGSSSYYYDRWIVLERNDGKRIFLPAQTIKMIVEAGGEGSAS